VVLLPRTCAARLYGAEEAAEDYYCNYGVNTDYRLRLEACGLRVSGVGGEGEIRIVEEDNRVALYFPDKPSAEIRSELKSNGFRWAPSVESQRSPVEMRLEEAQRESLALCMSLHKFGVMKLYCATVLLARSVDNCCSGA
jgi:hypothetical protein